MAYGAGIERECRYQIESTFGSPPDSDWSDGIVFLCVDPDVTSLGQQLFPNGNYRQRALSTREMVKSLKSGSTVPMGVYAHGRSTAVADDARATVTTPNFPLGHFMQCAWGGERLGYRTILASGTAAAPVVEAADGAQYAAGDWGFFADQDAPTEYRLRKIASVSTDTLTMWPGHDLDFTPANGDILAAVISYYPHTDILKNKNHASHKTMSFLFFGDLSEDSQEIKGCKLNLVGIEGTAPGEAPLLMFEAMVADFTNSGITQPTAGTPLGDAPLMVATGDDTFVWISAVGVALAEVEAHSVSITPGIASQAIMGVGGINGVHGYNLAGGSLDATACEIVVDYDDSWATAFEAGTKFQVLLQVGVTPGRAWGMFMAECELVEDPKRTVTTDMATTTLKFRPLESSISTAATGDNLEKVRAKIEMLFSCATS